MTYPLIKDLLEKLSIKYLTN